MRYLKTRKDASVNTYCSPCGEEYGQLIPDDELARTRDFYTSDACGHEFAVHVWISGMASTAKRLVPTVG
jgi:hypothetical protein